MTVCRNCGAEFVQKRFGGKVYCSLVCGQRFRDRERYKRIKTDPERHERLLAIKHRSWLKHRLAIKVRKVHRAIAKAKGKA